MLQRIKDVPAFRRAYYGATSGVALQRYRPVLSAEIRPNRETLSLVPQWIDDATYAGSIFQYGLPPHIRPFIDEPISDAPTYTDLITHLARSIPNLRYLELGPSVGKTFFQVARAARDAELVAVDVEDINPALARLLTPAGREEWPTMACSVRDRPSIQSSYRLGSNKIDYIAGDLFDAATWDRLTGRTFNLIFSDAFHSPDALLMEWRNISERGILAEGPFAMVWDDMYSKGMRSAFYEIARDVMALRPGTIPSLEIYQGWVGKRERDHPIGVLRCGL